MATTTNPSPANQPAPQPQPTPAPAPRPQPAPPNPGTPPTEEEQKAATDKVIAERMSSPPEQPVPTQEEADAIREGRYDATAPEGQRVKSREEHAEAQRRAMQPQSGSGYATR